MCRKSMPSHSSIMEYWKNKYITKDFKISDNYLDGLEIVYDWGELVAGHVKILLMYMIIQIMMIY